jgi:hypothetical protein
MLHTPSVPVYKDMEGSNFVPKYKVKDRRKLNEVGG